MVGFTVFRIQLVPFLIGLAGWLDGAHRQGFLRQGPVLGVGIDPGGVPLRPCELQSILGAYPRDGLLQQPAAVLKPNEHRTITRLRPITCTGLFGIFGGSCDAERGMSRGVSRGNSTRIFRLNTQNNYLSFGIRWLPLCPGPGRSLAAVLSLHRMRYSTAALAAGPRTYCALTFASDSLPSPPTAIKMNTSLYKFKVEEIHILSKTNQVSNQIREKKTTKRI